MARMFTRPVWIVIGALLLMGLLIGWYSQRKSVDWQRSYETDDDAPFGTFLLHEQLPALFPEAAVQEVRRTAFDHLVFEPQRRGLYVFINAQLPFYNESSRELLAFVQRGNHVFMATTALPGELEEALGVQGMPLNWARIAGVVGGDQSLDGDSADLHLAAQPAVSFRFPPRDASNFWNLRPGTQAQVEGRDAQNHPNWVRVAYGEGSFWLHSQPNLFSNYYLLDSLRRPYLAAVLAQLPAADTVYWDQYYKVSNLRFRDSNRDSDGEDDENPDRPNLLAYMLQQPALAWALSLAGLGLLLFTLFEGKRRQRIIPPLAPLPNSTLDFTETIGRLYFQAGDHRKTAQKRVRVLLDRIRRSYYLDTRQIDEEFLRTLAAKSGLPEQEVTYLFRLIGRMQARESLSEEELLRLDQAIENFYEQAALRGL